MFQHWWWYWHHVPKLWGPQIRTEHQWNQFQGWNLGQSKWLEQLHKIPASLMNLLVVDLLLKRLADCRTPMSVCSHMWRLWSCTTKICFWLQCQAGDLVAKYYWYYYYYLFLFFYFIFSACQHKACRLRNYYYYYYYDYYYYYYY